MAVRPPESYSALIARLTGIVLLAHAYVLRHVEMALLLRDFHIFERLLAVPVVMAVLVALLLGDGLSVVEDGFLFDEFFGELL